MSDRETYDRIASEAAKARVRSLLSKEPRNAEELGDLVAAQAADRARLELSRTIARMVTDGELHLRVRSGGRGKEPVEWVGRAGTVDSVPGVHWHLGHLLTFGLGDRDLDSWTTTPPLSDPWLINSHPDP